jgi:hypothetical protein
MPRPKPFIRLFFGLFGWGALIALVFAVIGVALAIGAGEKAAHLRDEGATTDAVVVALTEHHRRSSRRSHGTSYQVTYRFQTGSGTYTATAALPLDRFRALSEGDRIPVQYWTRDPSQSEIVFGDAESDSLAGKVIAAIASGAAVVLGRLAWRDASGAAWLARHGQRSTATITGHSRTSVKINGLPLWRADWRNADGTTGSSARRFSAALPGIGSTVTVITDPQRRWPGCLESDVCT